MTERDSRSARDQLIHELRGRGESVRDIAEQVGLSTTRVSRILGSTGSAPRSTGGRRRHVCATPGCGRRLTAERSVFSTHTGQRYCWPTEGCTTWSDATRRRRRLRAAQEGTTP